MAVYMGVYFLNPDLFGSPGLHAEHFCNEVLGMITFLGLLRWFVTTWDFT